MVGERGRMRRRRLRAVRVGQRGREQRTRAERLVWPHFRRGHLKPRVEDAKGVAAVGHAVVDHELLNDLCRACSGAAEPQALARLPAPCRAVPLDSLPVARVVARAGEPLHEG